VGGGAKEHRRIRYVHYSPPIKKKKKEKKKKKKKKKKEKIRPGNFGWTHGGCETMQKGNRGRGKRQTSGRSSGFPVLGPQREKVERRQEVRVTDRKNKKNTWGSLKDKLKDAFKPRIGAKDSKRDSEAKEKERHQAVGHTQPADGQDPLSLIRFGTGSPQRNGAGFPSQGVGTIQVKNRALTGGGGGTKTVKRKSYEKKTGRLV